MSDEEPVLVSESEGLDEDEDEDEGEGEDGHLPLGFVAPDLMEEDDLDEDDEEEGEGEGEGEGGDPFNELLMNIMVPGVEDAPAMMHLLMSLSRSVGLMCVRQMNVALSETALKLQARWALGGAPVPSTGLSADVTRSEPHFRDPGSSSSQPSQDMVSSCKKSIRVLKMDPLANDVSPILMQPDAQGPSFLLASKNLISMQLLRPRAGNIASVKLISCEDRMREFADEHEHQNVDVQFVAFHGMTIELPPGCHLQG